MIGFVALFRLLRFFRMNVWLATMLDVLKHALVSIVGTVILIMFVLLAFAISAYIIFGSGSPCFKDFPTTFMTLWSIMFEQVFVAGL